MTIKHDYNFGGTIRITLLSSCQSGCNFCHLEGYKTSDELGTLNPAIASWKQTGKLSNVITFEDIQNSIKLAQGLELNNINFTGGEPTLHPFLIEFINTLSKEGMSVAVTTHAEIYHKKFDLILNSGLEWVIVSLHALTPEQYIGMDLVAQQIKSKQSYEDAVRYAKMRLDKKLSNISQAIEAQKNGIIKGIITNTVVLNVEQTKEIIFYCNNLGIVPRIQRDLNNKQQSQLLINSLISELNAVPIKETQAIGDSSGAGVDYKYHDPYNNKTGQFRLKDFGNVYIDEMCDKCQYKDTDSCRERFYGVRVEPGKIITCIDYTHDNLTYFNTEEFIKQIDKEGSVPFAIAQKYKDVMRLMNCNKDNQ